jgi:hypothetical protein
MILPLYLYESLVAGRPMPIDGTTAWAVAYVCVFPSILAYIAFNRSVELIGANRTGLAFHLMPVFGSLLAILLLGERFEGHHAVGIPLIAAGILLVFVPAIAMFAITTLMGGGANPTIGEVIQNQFTKARNQPFGAALGVLLLVLFFFSLWLSSRLRREEER